MPADDASAMQFQSVKDKYIEEAGRLPQEPISQARSEKSPSCCDGAAPDDWLSELSDVHWRGDDQWCGVLWGGGVCCSGVELCSGEAV